MFIPKLESTNSDLFVLVRPRRFGKTIFISMLDYYYNILHKDKFQDIFGRLEIGSNPTDEKNSYFVLSLSFAGIDSKNSESFTNSINDSINSRIDHFKAQYAQFFQKKETDEIRINTNDAVCSMRSLANFIKRRSKKLFIIIDNHDALVDVVLNDLSSQSYGDRIYASPQPLSLSLKYQRQSGTIDRIFSIIKEMSGQGFQKVFITGTVPIGLEKYNISFHPDFENMIGITENDIKKVLELIIPDDKSLQEKSMIILKENFGGFKFNDTQKNETYNIALVNYFFNNLQEKKKIPAELLDPNVDPSILNVLRKFPIPRDFMDELFLNDYGIYIHDVPDAMISIKNMFQSLQTDSWYILSFMHYFGNLTIGELENVSTNNNPPQTHYKIPNKMMKQQLQAAIKESFRFNKYDVQDDIKIAVSELFHEKEIRRLCAVITEDMLNPMKGIEIDHPRENLTKIVCSLAFSLLDYPSMTEIEVKKFDPENFTRFGNFLYNQKVHLEFKNIAPNNIILQDGRCYQRGDDIESGIKINKEIYTMDPLDVLELNLKFNIAKDSDENYLSKDLENISDVLENLKIQTRENKKWIENKFKHSIDSYYILRIGLYTLKFDKINL
eukprot:gene3295-5736_t